MITAEQIAGLREALEKAPARPWLYRPDKYDDWGFIRGGERTGFGLPVVALGRSGGLADDHDEHRRAGTDPYGPASELIVAAVNALPSLLDEIEALREALDPNETKAAYIGEVKERIFSIDEFGDEHWTDHTISWDSTKAIMAMIRKFAKARSALGDTL